MSGWEMEMRKMRKESMVSGDVAGFDFVMEMMIFVV